MNAFLVLEAAPLATLLWHRVAVDGETWDEYRRRWYEPVKQALEGRDNDAVKMLCDAFGAEVLQALREEVKA